MLRRMSAVEIIAEFPTLAPEESRRLAGAIFDLEAEVDILRDCDRRVDDHFSIPDAMESGNGRTITG